MLGAVAGSNVARNRCRISAVEAEDCSGWISCFVSGGEAVVAGSEGEMERKMEKKSPRGRRKFDMESK